MPYSSKLRLRSFTYAALGAALLSASACLALPLPIPVTLQSFALFLLLSLFGKIGLLSLLLYYGIGLVGLPVFSGFTGGIAAFFAPAGGYLLAFLPAALLFLLLKRLMCPEALAATAATLLIYLFGSLHFFFLYTSGQAEGLLSLLLVTVVPYILPDAAKLTLALLLSHRLKEILNRSAVN